MLGRAGTVALALAAAATLAVGVGSAGAAAHAKKPLCRLSQDIHSGACTPNPAFARTICASFVPALQQAAPGVAFNQGYFPSWTGSQVGCWYTMNGHRQAAYVRVGGGAFDSGSISTGQHYVGKALAPAVFQDAWNMDMQEWQQQSKDSCPFLTQAAYDQSVMAGGPDGTPWNPPVKRTVAGYPAITWDKCDQLPHGKVGFFDPANTGISFFAHTVLVLAGDEYIEVLMGAPGVDTTSGDLFPLVEQLIAQYKRWG